MIGFLLERGVARIVGADVDEHAVAAAQRMHAGARARAAAASRGDDTRSSPRQCDILAPNADRQRSSTPGPSRRSRRRIVCGAANNQLEDAAARRPGRWPQRGILYVPDFLANRMGIVNCANEQYGTFDDDPAILRHLERDEPTGIFQRSHEIYERARASGRTPAAEAELLAEELSEEPHPIWGDRSRQIIAALVREGWHER